MHKKYLTAVNKINLGTICHNKVATEPSDHAAERDCKWEREMTCLCPL